MSFQDIFKSSFLENVTEFSLLDTCIGLAVALLVGLFIFMIYKKTLTGVLYSDGFALTLVGLSLVTTLVIMAVTSNVVLAVGIVIGAGMIPLAIIGSAIIGVILLLFANRKIRKQPYILVMSCKDEVAEQRITEILAKAVEYYTVKSKTVNAAGIAFTAELRTKNAETAFVNRITELEGVENATLVSYNGEYMG